MELVKNRSAFKRWQTLSFSGRAFKRLVDVIGGGYTNKLIDEMYTKLSAEARANKDRPIIVMNDFNFTAADYLYAKGHVNLYMISTADAEIENYLRIVYNNKNFKELFPNGNPYKKIFLLRTETVSIPKFNKSGKVSWKKVEDLVLKGDYAMLYNLIIIANPPYGKIGANITKKIIDTVDFDEYVNLLPANDYKRNDSKDLFNYQSDMVAINDGFKGDATVTTHLAKIHKNKVNNMTLDEFERSQYVDRQLDKYFEENSKKALTFSAAADLNIKSRKQLDISKTALFGWRDGSHRHMPYSKTVPTYLWNKEESITTDWLYDNTKYNSSGVLFFSVFYFKTAQEKQNFVTFIYSDAGFKFLSKLFTAMNLDGGLFIEKWVPKVDWTRSWTVEEILADYGYTEDEIKEVMEDLKNYNGMED